MAGFHPKLLTVYKGMPHMFVSIYTIYTIFIPEKSIKKENGWASEVRTTLRREEHIVGSRLFCFLSALRAKSQATIFRVIPAC